MDKIIPGAYPKGWSKNKDQTGYFEHVFKILCVYVFINFKSNLIWDDRLWTNCTNLTDDCSRKSKVTKRMRKNQNWYMTFRQEIELSCTCWRNICSMHTRVSHFTWHASNHQFIKNSVSTIFRVFLHLFLFSPQAPKKQPFSKFLFLYYLKQRILKNKKSLLQSRLLCN